MRLHVVDGTYELYRAHFSKRPSHSAPDGMDIKATVGIVASKLALLQDSNGPDRVRSRTQNNRCPFYPQCSLELIGKACLCDRSLIGCGHAERPSR